MSATHTAYTSEREHERCEHGVSLYAACEPCERHGDGSDGSSAGEYRALAQQWQTYLDGVEQRRRELYRDDEEYTI